MNFHSRDFLSEMRESVLYRFFGLGRNKAVAPGYVAVGADFDVHHYSLQGVRPVWALGHSLQQRVPSIIASSFEAQTIDGCQVQGNQMPLVAPFLIKPPCQLPDHQRSVFRSKLCVDVLFWAVDTI